MDARTNMYNTFMGILEMQQSVMFMDKLYLSNLSEDKKGVDQWSFAVNMALKSVENNFAPGQA